ncbi:hypothetical protein FBU59_006759, partial [Linderina macrospora]
FLTQITSFYGFTFSSTDVGTYWATESDNYNDITTKVFLAGDCCMARVAIRSGTSGTMSEQFTRTTGFKQGAHNLAWSYEALTASARHHAQAAAVIYS